MRIKTHVGNVIYLSSLQLAHYWKSIKMKIEAVDER